MGIHKILPKAIAEHQFSKSEGVGDLKNYRKNAKEGCDVLFRVRIKGKSSLEKGIPFHMSIKIFKSIEEANLDKIKKQVSDLKLTERPNPKNLKFKNSIFTGRDGNKYYMIMVEGLDPKFKKFYETNSDRGTVYDNGFMPHFTINKELYEDIKKDGLRPEDVEFGPLILEEGAGNTAHEFESKLEKGAIKNTLATLGTAVAMAGSPAQAPAAGIMPHSKMVSNAPQKQNTYSSQRMLNTIADVESTGGKFTEHKAMGGMHHGEKAFGRYGLTPAVIRDTVHMNPDLKNKHKKLMALQGDEVRRYMEDNPGLEDAIASKHLSRLEHHFGQDPAAIGYAWLNGVSGTYKAKKENKDINNHWHVQKIANAYSRIK